MTRKLPAPEGGRVETGPVQFGDDWPGVFIRGDNAFGYAMELQGAIAKMPECIEKMQMEWLCELLGGAIVMPTLPNSELLKMAENSAPPEWLKEEEDD